MYDGIVAARVSGSVQSLRRTSMMERVGVYRYRTSMMERVDLYRYRTSMMKRVGYTCTGPI
jgi:hypothetical protein